MKKLSSFFIVVFVVSLAQAATVKGKVVSSVGKPLAYTVVYIEKIEGKIFEPPKDELVMDQKKLTFVPHVLPVVAGTTVRFPNSDDVRHNVFSPSKTKKFNLGTYPKGRYKTVTFDKSGVVACLCNVHAEMSGFIVVMQNPYFAVTNKEGIYEIKDAPQGNFNLAVWHEKMKGKPVAVTVPAEKDKILAVDFKLAR